MPLTTDQLSEISGQIAARLAKANRNGTLFSLLHAIGMESLLDGMDGVSTTNPLAGIMVIGSLGARQNELLGVANSMGFDKGRFRFLDYNEAKSYDFRHLQYNQSICLVLIGPTPHKTRGTSDSRSLVSELEMHPDMYPRTERMTASNGELHISKNNFRSALERFVSIGAICPDNCQEVVRTMF